MSQPDIFDESIIDEQDAPLADTAPTAVVSEVEGEVEPEERPTPVIDVTVSKDKLSAYLTISQQPPQPYQVTVDDIYEALAAAKVEYGVMLEKIELLVTNQSYPSQELIAVGKEMVPGVDVALEYLVSVSGGGRPKDMGHYVNHYDLSLVENVTAGQVLVRKIPLQPGVDGKSVFGQPLRAPRAKDIRLPAGKGTQISPENPNELIAKTNGFVRLDTHSFNKVVVEDVFTVGGSVDLSTGNLDIEGSVTVHGHVREGFQVKATGNIKVFGRVESALVEAGGSIEILGGIIGGKNGAKISATDNISVKFADNATIIAGSAINIGEEAINCTLHADKSITVMGRTPGAAGAIIGGFVSAGYQIRAVSVGNDAGILTRLRVGEQRLIMARKQNMEIEIKTHRNKLADLKPTIETLRQRRREREPAQHERSQQKATLEKKQAELYEKMRAILATAEGEGSISLAAAIDTLREQIDETRSTLQRVEASIETLKQRIEVKTSIADSLKNKKTLGQFKSARESLITKLSDLEEQLAQRSANPWGNLPWATRHQLEQIQEQLKNINVQLVAIETEDATDQRISDALKQLCNQRDELQDELDSLQEEFELLKQEIEEFAQKTPHLIVSEKLWAGAEVSIGQRRRRFTKNRTGVKVQLSEHEAIITLDLA